MKQLGNFVLTLVILVSISACGKPADSQSDLQAPTWQEQYDLGVRYLSEGNYEEAIIAFTAAIEIDPKQAPAYVGRGDTYAAIAKQEMDSSAALELWEKAVADYECAVKLGDSQAEEKLEETREILQQLQERQDTQPLLEALYERFNADDMESAKALMRHADYQALSASVSEGFYFYGQENGSGLAVYPDNFYYYGQWKGGLRSGQGLWICAAFEDGSASESYTYEGAWANDRPNGEGRIVRNRYLDQIHLEPGYTTSVKTEITGTFADGLYHGTIYEVWNMNDGGTHIWSPITAVNGVYQAVEEEDGDIIVAYDSGAVRAVLQDDGSVHAVQGFGSES